MQNDLETVRGYTEAVLTPNVMEFARLCKAAGVDPEATADRTLLCQELAQVLGGVTVIQKGAKDYISNGRQTVVCDVPGGLKRSGGQGDTLTGCLATFLAWKKAYRDRLWECVPYPLHEQNRTETLIDGKSRQFAVGRRADCPLGVWRGGYHAHVLAAGLREEGAGTAGQRPVGPGAGRIQRAVWGGGR